MEKKERKALRRKGVSWIVSAVVHCLVILILGSSTFFVIRCGSKEEPKETAILMKREFSEQQYDECLKRAIFATPPIGCGQGEIQGFPVYTARWGTPRIECERMGEKPLILLEEAIEITKDIPRGTSFDNLTNKNLNSTTCIDAFGIGGGRAGAFGQRWGKGALIAADGRMGPVCGGSKTPNGEPYDAMFFKHYGVNPEIQTDDNKFSTFGVDVDTASFTLCRRYINGGDLPPEEAVRVEEFINFFDYGYAAPKEGTFAIYLDAARTPFAENNRVLLRIGVKAREIDESKRKDANLTFVIDTSGSMGGGGRLEMVKKALEILISRLRPSESIAIVEYSTDASVALQRTSVADKDAILARIAELHPRQSTNAYAGLKLGYEIAMKGFDKDRINKVILCSDGVANEAHTDAETILKEVEEYRNKGITLFCAGFGMGNYNDVLLEKLGDKGDGHYAYIDNLAEANRVFLENVTGTLQTVAKDAKVQVEFNPETVVSYRLLGYENRNLKKEDFRNDKVDSGEVGAGHSVTALYVVKMRPEAKGSIGTVRLRWKDVETTSVEEMEKTLSAEKVVKEFDSAPASLRLAAVVAQFAEILRKSYWADEKTLKGVMEITEGVSKEMKNEKASDFVRLARNAVDLKRKIQGPEKPEIAVVRNAGGGE